MEILQGHLELFAAHAPAVVFTSSFIEGAGIPFPGRIILIAAAALVPDAHALVGLVACATVGALLGDHVPYFGGAVIGPRLLDLYCRLTLGSERCVANAIALFQRFGAAAVLFGRFSTTVRLLAAALSGCGHISYPRFLVSDAIGTLLYAFVWATLGYLFGAQVGALLRAHGPLLLLVVPALFLGLLGYRLWRRSRSGPARSGTSAAALGCDDR